ncbi:MAG: pyruvate, phosphate dikinase [Candidatus Aminicenantes bacterium]|nr:MAG: pyruvate, phosphate dikinase [Candidatus Aminicenantes bacterium]
MGKKYVYFFSKDFTEGRKELKELLGGKGANLAEMCNLKLPIPPGFTITTEVCDLYYKNNQNYPEGLEQEVQKNLETLENLMRKKLGDKDNPLLVSVRSGAAVSMPGMMDTILNLGLNDISVEGLARRSNNERFIYDSYRRFIEMFGNVVLGIEIEKFWEVLDAVKMRKGVVHDLDLDVEDLKEMVIQYKNLVKEETGENFPQDTKIQLWKSIDAVFGSWNNPRAIKYRKLNSISGLRGTAVNVQSMVFGNMGETSGTGVAFSRNPSTGENKYYGEYLMNAQGEDVVAGIRIPHPVSNLEKQNPEIFQKLLEFKDILEKHYRDMQDMEFTIEEGRLYLLQTRAGKRTGRAAINVAVDMVHEGLITKKEAIMRIKPEDVEQLLIPSIDPNERYLPLARGYPASPGVAIGEIVFTAEKAEHMTLAGKKVILVRKETSPEDIGGMDVAQGILTSTGGMTSHASVVLRRMGKCCVAGCSELAIFPDHTCQIAGKFFKEGDIITIDGSKGEVIAGALKLIAPGISGKFEEFMQWVDEERTIGVRTNADTPKDSAVARKFGAEGIGLCRTEHMFFEGERIDAIHQMIMAATAEDRAKALGKILPMQKEDFIAIFETMAGYPVTIRLLNSPLHEFIPQSDEELKDLAAAIGVEFGTLKTKAQSLKEFNPMLGHRGCRLAITYPEIAVMQTEAVIQAALTVKKKGINVFPEIMIPLVGTEKEFEYLREIIVETANKIFEKENDSVEFLVGTMIEIPRACLVADKIAETAQFFSFGTNDLTQMTFGYSRDDAGVFLPEYLSKEILTRDPFQVIDQEGIGRLIRIGIERGRKTRPDLKVGICGEHGGEPGSIEFCYRIGMDYVSCSPYRVPIARLVAAQAKIKAEKNKTNS